MEYPGVCSLKRKASAGEEEDVKPAAESTGLRKLHRFHVIRWVFCLLVFLQNHKLLLPQVNPIQMETNLEGKDHKLIVPPNTRFNERIAAKSSVHCKVEKVVFTDKDRNPRRKFLPTEDKCVLITFVNPANELAFILCNPTKFSRSNTNMNIGGYQDRYSHLRL